MSHFDLPVSRGRAAAIGEDAAAHDALALGQELANDIQRKFMEKLRSREKPKSRATNRASSLGDPCLRRLVLWRTKGEEAREDSDFSLALFNYGGLLEGPVRRLIEDLGFEIDRSQKSFPQNDYNVSGRIDGIIHHRRMPVCFVLEIKGLNGVTWKQLNTAEDIREHAKSWVSKYASQGQIYSVLSEIFRWKEGDESPILGVAYALWNKWTGELKVIPAPLDYKFAEELLDKSLVIEAHVEAKTLPDFIDKPKECESCPFLGRACHPPINFTGDPMQVIDDVDVVAALECLENNAEAAVAHKEAKEFLFGDGGRLRGASYVIVPHPTEEADWHIKAPLSQHTTYKVPEEIRAPYKHTDPEGACRPKVEKIKRGGGS